MDYIELERSSIYALQRFGSITFNGEKITIPPEDTLADRMVSLDRSKDLNVRYADEGIATYIILHTTKEGKKIIANFDTYHSILKYSI